MKISSPAIATGRGEGMAVFKHLHLTKLQWQGVLRWGLYSLALLVTLVLETVLFGKLRVLGAKLTIVPLLLCCAAIREGPEKGGLFALIGSVLWCFSGTDMGNLSVAAVTVMAVLSAVLCKAVLTDSLVSSALCCLVTLLVNGGVIFAFKLLLTPISPRGIWLVLGSAVLSTLLCPAFYYLCKAISRTGGSHGV